MFPATSLLSAATWRRPVRIWELGSRLEAGRPEEPDRCLSPMPVAESQSGSLWRSKNPAAALMCEELHQHQRNRVTTKLGILALSSKVYMEFAIYLKHLKRHLGGANDQIFQGSSSSLRCRAGVAVCGQFCGFLCTDSEQHVIFQSNSNMNNIAADTMCPWGGVWRAG